MISLQKACLNLIVQKFEKFHSAFAISNDQSLIRNFEFLQRVYTLELMSELYKRRKLKDKYLDFLLNIHLKFLDRKWFENSRYRNAMKEVFCRLPNLLNISSEFICNDEILENIAKFCPHIVEIEASHSHITDTGLKYLCQNENGKVPCSKLKSVCVFQSAVTDEGVKYLIRNLPFLENIEYQNVPKVLYSLLKEDLHNLEKLSSYNLVHLDFPKMTDLPYYTDLLKICLTVCPRLKSIKCYISDKGQLDVLKSASLVVLNLYYSKPNSKIDINSFLRSNVCNLMSLTVWNCILSVNVLSANCPKLRDLNLNSVDFLDDADDSQSPFHRLTTCAFRHIKDENANIKAMCSLLSSSPKLESLRVHYCPLSPETRTRVLNCCKNNVFLKCITIAAAIVEMRYVKEILLSCLNLKTLSVESLGFSFNEYKELTKFVKGLSTKPNVYVNNVRMNDYDYDKNVAGFIDSPF